MTVIIADGGLRQPQRDQYTIDGEPVIYLASQQQRRRTYHVFECGTRILYNFTRHMPYWSVMFRTGEEDAAFLRDAMAAAPGAQFKHRAGTFIRSQIGGGGAA